MRLDAADLDERAAIVEVDGNIPPIYAARFAALMQACPDGVPIPRWQMFVDDGGHFLDAWGHQAAALGWTPQNLFGLHETKPLVRHDATGLLWLLKGERVVALTSTAARLSGGLVYRRTHPQPSPECTGQPYRQPRTTDQP
ncbi:hypothetical protein [Alsobacter sp. R-9]